MTRRILILAILLFGMFVVACKRPSNDEASPQSYEEACEDLTFSEDDIRSIIAQSPLVRGEVWHYQHHAAPCSHDGVIAFNGKLRNYRYYPTGYMWLEGYEGWLMCYDCSVYPDWIIFDGDYENSTKGAEYKERFKDLIITPDTPSE